MKHGKPETTCLENLSTDETDAGEHGADSVPYCWKEFHRLEEQGDDDDKDQDN